MEGFSRHKIEDFAVYNAQALSRIQAVHSDVSMLAYTFSIPDVDPAYCWAREEPIFTSLMTPQELATVVSKPDGMRQDANN